MTATTSPPVPDWLARRGGAIQAGIHPETRFVLIGGEPLYKLEVRPAAGRFACAVTNSANGSRIDDATTRYENFNDAVAGGLGRLREKLGW